MERSKEKDCFQLLNEINVLKAIYWIKQAWNDVKCDTIAKCFKKCGFVDNTAKNLAEDLFGANVDMWIMKKVMWWWQRNWFQLSCEESPYLINQWVDRSREFTKDKWWSQNKLRSHRMWYYWSSWRKGKSRTRRRKGGCYWWLLNGHDNIEFSNSFKSCYLPKAVFNEQRLCWCSRRLIKSGK